MKRNVLGWAVSRILRAVSTALVYAGRPLLFESLGRGCHFEGWVDVPQRGGSIRIGSRVHFCAGVSLTVLPGARLILEDGVFVGRGVVVSAHEEVRIGANTMLAEYVCIHDNDHAVGGERAFDPTAFVCAPVNVGRNCWIGAHAVLTRGAALGDGSVLGAGAVLTNQMPEGARAVGVPARNRAALD